MSRSIDGPRRLGRSTRTTARSLPGLRRRPRARGPDGRRVPRGLLQLELRHPRWWLSRDPECGGVDLLRDVWLSVVPAVRGRAPQRRRPRRPRWLCHPPRRARVPGVLVGAGLLHACRTADQHLRDHRVPPAYFVDPDLRAHQSVRRRIAARVEPRRRSLLLCVPAALRAAHRRVRATVEAARRRVRGAGGVVRDRRVRDRRDRERPRHAVGHGVAAASRCVRAGDVPRGPERAAMGCGDHGRGWIASAGRRGCGGRLPCWLSSRFRGCCTSIRSRRRARPRPSA